MLAILSGIKDFRYLTVPPVIVSGQPDDDLSAFMQLIALQFT